MYMDNCYTYDCDKFRFVSHLPLPTNTNSFHFNVHLVNHWNNAENFCRPLTFHFASIDNKYWSVKTQGAECRLRGWEAMEKWETASTLQSTQSVSPLTMLLTVLLAKSLVSDARDDILWVASGSPEYVLIFAL